MAIKSRETEYMYSSARIRALETRLVSGERLNHMLEARSSADILATLGDCGFTLMRDEESGVISREATLMSALEEGFREAEQMPNTAGLMNFLRYPYDCHNIKSVMKCFVRGIDPKEMLFSFGTVTIELLLSSMRDRDYDGFPAEMAKAIPQAEEAFSATGNPQKVDLILDRACYADMLTAARESGVDLAVRLVETKIDLTNLLTCLRLIRMGLGVRGEAFLEEALLEGGMIEIDFFRTCYEGGESVLAERLGTTRYSSLAEAIHPSTPFHVLEKLADDLYLGVAKNAKYVPFGAEVLIGYLYAVEYAIKNIRLILAGKDAGLSSEVLRERLRDCYV